MQAEACSAMTLSGYQNRIETVLDRVLDKADTPARLQQAMRYSVLGGGKRIRALLVYAAGEAVSANLEKLDHVAVALEMIHAYSLIHDDLPAMDDDALRRGKASSHIEFGEATAILAGDALLTLAFETVNRTDSKLSDTQARQISQKLSEYAGRTGMVGGQMLDILATDANASISELESMHKRKTGALIQAAAICGGLCAQQIAASQLKALERYSNNLGLAFQVVDDVLDIEASTEELGKASGADQRLGKSTYPALLGLQESKNLIEKLYQQAIACIPAIGDNNALLVELATLIVRRSH